MATLTVFTYSPDASYAIAESQTGQILNKTTGLLEAYNVSNLLDYYFTFAANGPPGRLRATANVDAATLPVILNGTIYDANGLPVGSFQTELNRDGNESGLIDGLAQSDAIATIGAIVGGKITTAGTGSEAFKGFNGTRTRATVTVDSNGNRSAVDYS